MGAGDRLTVDQALHLARILRGFDDLAKAGIDPWQHAEPETVRLVRVSLVELRRQARRTPDAVPDLAAAVRAEYRTRTRPTPRPEPTPDRTRIEQIRAELDAKEAQK